MVRGEGKWQCVQLSCSQVILYIIKIMLQLPVFPSVMAFDPLT
jgi:hypothetical protein